jgi:hypothetical protein
MNECELWKKKKDQGKNNTKIKNCISLQINFVKNK